MSAVSVLDGYQMSAIRNTGGSNDITGEICLQKLRELTFDDLQLSD